MSAADVSNEDNLLLFTFVEESRDHIQFMIEKLVAIDVKCPKLDDIHALFRSIHTIKGCSRSLHLAEIGNLSHAAEELLVAVRSEQLKMTAAIVDALLKVCDLLEKMIQRAADHQGSEDFATPIEASIKQMRGFVPKPDTVERVETPTVVPAFGFFEDEAQAPPSAAMPTSPVASAPTEAKQDQSIRIRYEKIEAYVNLASELMIARNSLLHALAPHESVEEQSRLLKQAAQTLDRLTTDIHHNAMGMRMVPVKNIFQKVPRIIRDISQSLGKSIELRTNGEDVEVDRQVAEALTDPLMHLIRNSIDHGIEKPERRRELGKDPTGHITLKASQRGGSIWIEVIDDGGGIDCDRLKRKASERGLISEEQLQSMTEADATKLIFLQGLSTAHAVTDISGRGVGMDVVKSNVVKMGGQIHIQSRVGEGTIIRIELPLSLSVMNALILEAGPQVYALPSDAVQEMVKVDGGDLHDVNGVPSFTLRDQLIPCFELARLEGGAIADRQEPARSDVIVVHAESGPFGILVDRLQSRQEIVVKPLPKALAASLCFGGAAILGNGSVVLVVEPGNLPGFLTNAQGSP